VRDAEPFAGCSDYEYPLNSPSAWDWFCRLAQNPNFELTVHGIQNEPEPEEDVEL